jgi:hypothetical protein
MNARQHTTIKSLEKLMRKRVNKKVKPLPQRGWHVTVQKQQRVRPTQQIQEGFLDINDDRKLEEEADLMGKKALVLFRKRKKRGRIKITHHKDNVISNKKPVAFLKRNRFFFLSKKQI